MTSSHATGGFLIQQWGIYCWFYVVKQNLFSLCRHYFRRLIPKTSKKHSTSRRGNRSGNILIWLDTTKGKGENRTSPRRLYIITQVYVSRDEVKVCSSELYNSYSTGGTTKYTDTYETHENGHKLRVQLDSSHGTLTSLHYVIKCTNTWVTKNWENTFKRLDLLVAFMTVKKPSRRPKEKLNWNPQ